MSQVAAVWRSVCGVTLPSERSSFATSTARAKPLFTGLTPAPCQLDEVVGDDLLVVAAPHVDQQTVRQRHRGLTLVRSAPADRQTVIEAAVEIDVCVTLLLARRGRRNR